MAMRKIGHRRARQAAINQQAGSVPYLLRKTPLRKTP
jgi:hypothetical protein